MKHTFKEAGPGKSHGRANADAGLIIGHLSAIEHVLLHRPDWVASMEVRSPSSRVDKLVDLASKHRIPVSRPGRAVPGLSNAEESSSVSVRLKAFPYHDISWLHDEAAKVERHVVLALDHVQDPQNFGAICRSAEAFGVNAILLPTDRSVQATSGAFAASVGAIATVPIVRVVNLGEGLRKLKQWGFWIVGTDGAPSNVPVWKAPDFEKAVLVMGAEGEGLTKLVGDLCDYKVRIPMTGKIQSLNVSAATAALLYEWCVRRRES